MDTILNTSTKSENGRRTALGLGSSHFHPPSTTEEINNAVEMYAAEIAERYSLAAIEASKSAAEQKIHELECSKRRREEFHGKNVLSEFYKQYLHSTGLSKVVFTFETARHARRRRAVVSFFDELFNRLNFPSP